MNEAAIWDIERDLWLGGVAEFERAMAPGCVMVFPEPVGILAGPAILDGLRQAPRWSAVEMTGRQISLIGDSVAVLAYRATGQRGDSPLYRALCCSTYFKQGEAWHLVQHQQTPI